MRDRVTVRVCSDCGASGAEAAFTGARKPYGQRDRCTDCIADPLAAASSRVVARRAEIAALREAGRFRAAKPIHTAPLFAWLRETTEGKT